MPSESTSRAKKRARKAPREAAGNGSGTCPILALPPDILLRIVAGFSFADLLRVAAVCSRWRAIVLRRHAASRIWHDVDLPRSVDDAAASRMLDLIPDLGSVETLRAPFCRNVRKPALLLARLPSLTALDVRAGPRIVSPDGLPASLRVLDLAAQPIKALERLPDACPDLSLLSLSGIPPLPHYSILACVGGLHALVTLDLSAIHFSSSLSLLAVVSAAPPTITSLKLDRLNGGSGAGGVGLARGEPPANLGKLERLSFRHNASQWSGLLLLFLLATPSLRRLNVGGSTIPPLMRLLDCDDGHWKHLEVVQMPKAVQRLDHFALDDGRRVLPPSLLTAVLTLPPLPSPLRALDVSAIGPSSVILQDLDAVLGETAPAQHLLGVDPPYLLAADGVLDRARLGLAGVSHCRICSLPLDEAAVEQLGQLAPALGPGGSGALDARSCRSLNRKLRMQLSSSARGDEEVWDW